MDSASANVKPAYVWKRFFQNSCIQRRYEALFTPQQEVSNLTTAGGQLSHAANKKYDFKKILHHFRNEKQTSSYKLQDLLRPILLLHN